jgi:hypothetical protein
LGLEDINNGTIEVVGTRILEGKKKVTTGSFVPEGLRWK